MELDQNNQYGGAQCEKLPVNNYKWCDEEEIKHIEDNFLSIECDKDIGYILQVDLKIPRDKYNFFKDFPIAPINEILKEEDFSEYQKTLIKNGIGLKSKKLNYYARLRIKQNMLII
jgi:hypothetical protein